MAFRKMTRAGKTMNVPNDPKVVDFYRKIGYRDVIKAPEKKVTPKSKQFVDKEPEPPKTILELLKETPVSDWTPEQVKDYTLEYNITLPKNAKKETIINKIVADIKARG